MKIQMFLGVRAHGHSSPARPLGRIRWILVAAVTAMLGLSAAPAVADHPSPSFCDRACLQGFASEYLEALAARDPSRVALAPNVRFTEEGAALAIGDGLWATAGKTGPNRLDFVDPATGQIAVYTQVTENGSSVMLGMRLRVVERQITEVETTVIRKRPGFFAPEAFAAARPLWSEVVPVKRRMPRQALVDIANSYFEGITQARGDITPFDDECIRYENGVAATSNPALNNEIRAMNCTQQFKSGILKFVTSITHRRFFVDEERQVVFALGLFNHRGNVLKVTRRDTGATYDPPAEVLRPFSYLITEAFKIRDGKIALIEATVQTVPYRMNPGWPAEPERTAHE